MGDSTPKSYHTDPTLWLYTSLTAGSSHIITATSRLEVILKANKIPFKALDVATDEKARMLWGRRAGKRKLPGLMRMGMVVADLEEVEEWNEYGEIKQNLLFSSDNPSAKAAAAVTPTPSATNTPSKPPPPPSTFTQPSAPSPSTQPPPVSENTSTTAAPTIPSAPSETPLAAAMRQASLEAAAKANASKAKLKSTPTSIPTFSADQSATTLSGVGTGAQPELLAKLDNSAPGDALPPTGSTAAPSNSALFASELQTDTEGAADKDKAKVIFKGSPEAESMIAHAAPAESETQMHQESSLSAASKEETEAVEEATGIKEEPEKEAVASQDPKPEVVGGAFGVKTAEVGEVGEVGEGAGTVEKGELESEGGVKTEDATAAADDSQALPGTRTQEQEAGEGSKAEESVAD